MKLLDMTSHKIPGSHHRSNDDKPEPALHKARSEAFAEIQGSSHLRSGLMVEMLRAIRLHAVTTEKGRRHVAELCRSCFMSVQIAHVNILKVSDASTSLIYVSQACYLLDRRPIDADQCCSPQAPDRVLVLHGTV